MISVNDQDDGGEELRRRGHLRQADARIVRIEKFSMEVIPEGHMIVLYNNDKPGVIGNLGTTLGSNGINIARFQLSASTWTARPRRALDGYRWSPKRS